MKETPEERCARILAKYSKTLPRIFGDPLLQGIRMPDQLLEEQSTCHIALYALGFLQELAARVKQVCQDPRETSERKGEACQLLVNIATEAAADIHLLFERFPEPFRTIAETRSNFPCLFPAHPEQRKALNQTLLEHLALGKFHALKLRPKPGRKPISMGTYANNLLRHYLAEIHRMRAEVLSFRLNDPWALAVSPPLEIERLVDETPLCVANVKPWIKVIWQLLLKDFSEPEADPNLRSFGNRPSRTQRASDSGVEDLIRGKAGMRKGRHRTGASEALLVRDAIKEALEKYLVRMLREGKQPTSDK